MKTVYTLLPIYKSRASQAPERAVINGAVVPLDPYIHTPKHRLPSFQWLDDGDGCATVTSVEMINGEGVSLDITSYFVTLPTLYESEAGDDYFVYGGDTLNYALPIGNYYLKITMDNDYVYYSDWFTVDCVYCNFIDTFENDSFDTFDIDGTVISSCIDAGANAYADSTPFQEVYKGQEITIMFYLTETGLTNPKFSLVSSSLGVISNVVVSAAGLNEITLTATQAADDVFIRMQTTSTTNFSTSEILVYTQYACKFVTLSFSNCCNLGDILYEDDFTQTMWIPSDNIETQFPYVEKGQENGDGRFIPTFRRQEKTFQIRTGYLPIYVIEVLHRLKIHDLVTYIDQVGDAFIIQSIDVEHEWNQDKYYAMATITIDTDEAVISTNCCSYHT